MSFPLSIREFKNRLTMGASVIFNGVTTTTRQKSRTTALRDTQKELTREEWKLMTCYGRQLYAQLGEIRGACLEKAVYSVVGGWIPQFYGTDKAWGRKAEDWLWEWMKICDVRGDPYDFFSMLGLTSIGLDRDGDIAIVLTEGANQYPQIQLLSAHRIGCRGSESSVTVGAYKGLTIYNGVIFNTVGRPVAFRFLGDTADKDQDISARDMMLVFDPDWCDQARGISSFYHGILKLMDLQDVHDATLHGIKAAATNAYQVWNDSGEADSGRAYLTSSTSGASTAITIEEQNDGAVRYFRSGSGGKLEVLNDNRPSPNTSEFLETVLRGCYQGMEWPYEFTRNPEKIGGANSRMIVAKAMRSVEKRQKILGKVAVRIAGFALARASKIGLLPPSKEWWMFDWQMPRTITVDAGREAQQDREDYKMGITTLRAIYGAKGLWWEEQIDQRIAERKYIEEKCKAKGVDPRGVQLLTPNEQPENAKNKDGEDAENQNAGGGDGQRG